MNILVDDVEYTNMMVSFCEHKGPKDMELGEGRCCEICLVSTKRTQLNVSASLFLSGNACLWLMSVGCSLVYRMDSRLIFASAGVGIDCLCFSQTGMVSMSLISTGGCLKTLYFEKRGNSLSLKPTFYEIIISFLSGS